MIADANQIQGSVFPLCHLVPAIHRLLHVAILQRSVSSSGISRHRPRTGVSNSNYGHLP